MCVAMGYGPTPLVFLIILGAGGPATTKTTPAAVFLPNGGIVSTGN